MLRRDPYRAILNAAEKGRGLRLTADEVFALSRDSAIEIRAGIPFERRRRQDEEGWSDPLVNYGDESNS